MKTSVLHLVAPAVLATAAACGSSGSAALQYDTARVSRGDLVQYVTATGTLDAVVNVDVGTQVSGKVAALNADFNSVVKKGQLIAEIEATTYAAALRQAQGDRASSGPSRG